MRDRIRDYFFVMDLNSETCRGSSVRAIRELSTKGKQRLLRLLWRGGVFVFLAIVLRFGARQEFFHVREAFGVAGIFSEVLPFVRVGHVIVEFRAGCAAIPLSVAPMFGADAVAHDGFAIPGANLLGDGGEKPAGFGIIEQGAEASAFEIRRWFEAAIVGESRVEIDEFDGAGRDAGDGCFWQSDHKRDAGDFFEEQLLLPLAMFAERPAVIAEKDDDGVGGEV